MNTPPRPTLKSITSTPTCPGVAEPAVARPAVGEPNGAARKGVRTALRSDPQEGDGRYPMAWLNIRAPYGSTPSATSTCLCGRDRRAFGERRVLALIADHIDHREHCPLRPPREGRDAA
jgi:hypothetical protein